MRNQWRQLLLLHRCYRSSCQPSTSHLCRFQVPSFHPSIRFSDTPFYGSQFLRFFSSGLAVKPSKDSIFEKNVALLKDVFSKTELEDEKIKLELDANRIVLSDRLVNEALEDLRSAPDVALRFFNWVLESDDSKILSSEYCRLMLNILLDNLFFKEFYDTWGKVQRKYPFQRFPWFVECESRIQHVVYGVIEPVSWSDDLEEKLGNVEYSSDMVSWIVEKLGLKDDKGLMFFKWIKDSGLFKHDQHTFNVMLKVLAKEDLTERFWKMAKEMNESGFEMEEGVRNIAKERLFEKKTTYEFVNYMKFAMGGVNKVTPKDCSLMLTSALEWFKRRSMNRFVLVVRSFKKQGIVITDSMFLDIVSFLKKNDRLGEFEKIFKALEVEGDFIPCFLLHLAKGEKKSASEFTDNRESSYVNDQTFDHLISVFYRSNDLEKASTTLQVMLKYVDAYYHKAEIHTVFALYCDNRGAVEAFNLFSKWVKVKDVQPWVRTYKVLSEELLAKGRYTEATVTFRWIKIKPGSRRWLFYLIPEFRQFNDLEKASSILQDMVRYLEPSDSKDAIHIVVEAYCQANEVEKASSILLDMVEIVDAINYNDHIHTIIKAYCDKERAVDAFSFVSNLIQETSVRPKQATIDLLIRKLMAQGGFREVLEALPLFQTNGYKRPTLALFIEHLSKSGSHEEAITLTKTMTDVYSPFSPTQFLQRLINAYVDLGKIYSARELLFKCPKNLRMKSNQKLLFGN